MLTKSPFSWCLLKPSGSLCHKLPFSIFLQYTFTECIFFNLLYLFHLLLFEMVLSLYKIFPPASFTKIISIYPSCVSLIIRFSSEVILPVKPSRVRETQNFKVHPNVWKKYTCAFTECPYFQKCPMAQS